MSFLWIFVGLGTLSIAAVVYRHNICFGNHHNYAAGPPADDVELQPLDGRGGNEPVPNAPAPSIHSGGDGWDVSSDEWE